MAAEPRFCRRLASPETIDLLIVLALGTTLKTKRGHGGSEQASDCEGGGGGGERKGEDSGRTDDGDRVDYGGGGGGEPQVTAVKTIVHQVKRFSGEKVSVASPYVGALRYCVVTIVERLGSILDDGGEFERTSSTLEMTSMVVSLVVRRRALLILSQLGGWCWCWHGAGAALAFLCCRFMPVVLTFIWPSQAAPC